MSFHQHKGSYRLFPIKSLGSRCVTVRAALSTSHIYRLDDHIQPVAQDWAVQFFGLEQSHIMTLWLFTEKVCSLVLMMSISNKTRE